MKSVFSVKNASVGIESPNFITAHAWGNDKTMKYNPDAIDNVGSATFTNELLSSLKYSIDFMASPQIQGLFILGRK